MRTLIINGSSEPSGLDGWVARYGARLAEHLDAEQGGPLEAAELDDVEIIDLAGLGIKACTGCWSCWWATPGLCVLKDGMSVLYPKVIAADLVVWVVPLALGAQNALTKKAQERLIPLMHPYIEMVSGESHHRRRYESYPDMALVVQPGPDDCEEDLVIAKRLFERFALNFRSRLSYFATTARDPKEAADETLSA
jgi:hypothetical protein